MINNKQIAISVILMVTFICCIVGCGSNKATNPSDYTTYKFETFEGTAVLIDSHNIVSQEADANVFESSKVPENAEVIAPGRDYVYLADDTYYYVEDAVNSLVTKAKK